MDIIYRDESIIVCIKPAGVLSTDEPGGLPELLRRELGDEKADVRTVHRLDRAVSGLMVLARGAAAASELSRQVRDGEFEKHYMAVVHGEAAERATLTDLLYRDKARKMTFVTDTPAKGVQEAVLDYERKWYVDGLSEVYITLHTGRSTRYACSLRPAACRSSASENTASRATSARLRCSPASWASPILRRGSGCTSERSRPKNGRGRRMFDIL